MGILNKVDLGCKTCYLNDSRFKSLSIDCSAGVKTNLLKGEIRKLKNNKEKREEMINRNKYLKELKSFYEKLLKRIENQKVVHNGNKYIDIVLQVCLNGRCQELESTVDRFFVIKSIKEPEIILKESKKILEIENSKKAYNRSLHITYSIRSEAEENRIISKINTRIKEIEKELEDIDLNVIDREINSIQEKINSLVSEKDDAQCKSYKKELE